MATTDDRVPFIPDVDPKYPLLHISVAPHIGVYRYMEKDAEENLRRAKKVIQTYLDLGIALLTKNGGEPITANDITAELIAKHEGCVTGEVQRGTEAFEEHLLNIISNHTGVPRVSYLRIVREDFHRLNKPYIIVQEVDDRHSTEMRRVEIYADGRRLWRRDGECGEGTADEEFTESEYVWGLSILNQRPGQRAERATAEEFKRLWEEATSGCCGWITELTSPEVTRALALDGVLRCEDAQTDDSAFCAEHREMARRIFPVLFAAS
ncbi:DUF6881 domain-containing protein [Streptomyces kronopolitis]